MNDQQRKQRETNLATDLASDYRRTLPLLTIGECVSAAMEEFPFADYHTVTENLRSEFGRA